MAMVDANTIGAYRQTGRPAAQADWIRLKIGNHLALLCIHQMNRVNSRNGCAMMTAP